LRKSVSGDALDWHAALFLAKATVDQRTFRCSGRAPPIMTQQPSALTVELQKSPQQVNWLMHLAQDVDTVKDISEGGLRRDHGMRSSPPIAASA
jgi:hypothetical protein